MKNQKVRKAIIPAAGLGTRFLPATKALAKEMLPIVDKPTIQFIVEEALKSGIEDILVVTGKSKRSIEDHFDSNFELEYNLKGKGKTDLLKLVDETTGMRLHFIRQTHPRGLGDAVLQAKAFVGNEPFVVMLGDDLMDITDDTATTLTKQLMNDYDETHASTIAVMKVPHEEVSAYGVIAYVQNQLDILLVILAMIGGLLGFFVFNHKPAKVFMGDVGSLALGGMLAAISMALHQEWTLLIIGIVYVFETTSVMMQVSYFKMTGGKRIFRMTPVHHHFELGGLSGKGNPWSEWKVDFFFWGVGLLASLLTLAFLYLL